MTKTRSSDNWQGRPGNWDVLHSQVRFSSTNPLGIPDLLPQDFIGLPSGGMLRYNSRAIERIKARSLCHFFLDDYRFETVWSRPLMGLSHVRRYWAALTPDFSLYRDWPVMLQQWNVYRSRWVGRFWQEHGLRIIPTVNWSTPDSYDWCFLGIPQNQIVALTVPDRRKKKATALFEMGFWAMREILQPRLMLVYGSLPFSCDHVIEYPPDWVNLREVRRADRTGSVQPSVALQPLR